MRGLFLNNYLSIVNFAIAHSYIGWELGTYLDPTWKLHSGNSKDEIGCSLQYWIKSSMIFSSFYK